MAAIDEKFPCSLVIDIPFPSHRLAEIALKTLSVDEELSQLVARSFLLVNSPDGQSKSVLQTQYKATTNRMLRVAVNGFFESVAEIIEIMGELDTDVIHLTSAADLGGVQGVEQGLTGTTIAGA